MPTDSQCCFEPYRLEVRNAQLWCGTQALRLTAKAFDVLCYLVEHAGQLVTKDELFAAVWPELEVSEGVLTNCVGELRKALGETTQTSRLIATVRGRGYRFIAPVTRGGPVVVLAPVVSTTVSVAPVTPSPLVGRERELHALHCWLEQVLGGQRQVVFVTGETGIGKTTVVDAFLATTARAAPLWVAWGQCMAHYGAGEAYLPVLDAMGAAVPDAWTRASHRDAGPVRADVAGATARPAQPCCPGRRAAPGARRYTRAHAARTRRGSGSGDVRAAAGAGT